MPQLPQIDAPTVQPEAQQATAQPMPNAADFGAPIGEGLEQVGKELFQVGWEEYHRSAEAFAQQKETEFQAGALKIRDDYKNLHNEDAIGAHTKVTESIENLRKSLADSIPSRYGTDLFNNNSLRNARIVQESVDSHFEIQNRSFKAVQHKNQQNADVSMIASLATDQAYNSENIEKVITGIRDRELAFETSNGVDADTAQKMADSAAQKGTDALFHMLLGKNSNRDPEMVRSELEKYSKQGLVSPQIQKDAQGALNGSEVNTWVAKSMSTFVKIDADKNPDPEGFIPHSQVQAAIDTVDKNDPNRQLKIDKLEQEWKRHIATYNKAGAELENYVVRAGTDGDNGKFLIPENDVDWQKFQRLYPIPAKKLAADASGAAYRDQRRMQVNAKTASGDAYGATRYYLDKLSLGELKELSPDTVDQLMRANFRGPPGQVEPLDADKARAREFLQKLQTGKMDPLEKQFTEIATQTLNESYRGNTTKVRAAMNRAELILEDAHKADPKLDAKALRLKLVESFHKDGGLFGLFGSRSGETYNPRPVGAPSNAVQGKDGNWYIPNGPDKYLKWGGK